MDPNKYVKMYGPCVVPGGCDHGCASFESEDGSRKCTLCGHDKQQHAATGILDVEKGVIIPIPKADAVSSQSTTTPARQPTVPTRFIAPTFTTDKAELSSVFTTSAGLATKDSKVSDVGKMRSKVEKKMGSASDERTIPRVYILPLDHKLVPSTETEHIQLVNKKQLWIKYKFVSGEQVWIDLKLSSQQVGYMFSKHQFFFYLLEGKRNWKPTGCSHLRDPTDEELRGWILDTQHKSKPKKLIITPECLKEDVDCFSTGQKLQKRTYVDMTNSDDNKDQDEDEEEEESLYRRKEGSSSQTQEQQYQPMSTTPGGQGSSYGSNNSSASGVRYGTSYGASTRVVTVEEQQQMLQEQLLLNAGFIRGTLQFNKLMEFQQPAVRAYGAPPPSATLDRYITRTAGPAEEPQVQAELHPDLHHKEQQDNEKEKEKEETKAEEMNAEETKAEEEGTKAEEQLEPGGQGAAGMPQQTQEVVASISAASDSDVPAQPTATDSVVKKGTNKGKSKGKNK